MRKIKINGILNVPLFIMIILLSTIWGCGSKASEYRYSEAGESGSVSSSNKSITLSWERPALNSDGSDLNDLAGYKIYYGTSSNDYSQSIDVGNITSAVISSLSSGTWCFATTAYDADGNESGYSNEACTTI